MVSIQLSTQGYKVIRILNKRFLQHRLIYEQYYNCCLLPRYEIHHINGIKTDNRIENMKVVTKEQHRKIDKENRKESISQRTCFICNSNKTMIRKPEGYPKWYKYNGHFICHKCNNKRMRHQMVTGLSPF